VVAHPRIEEMAMTSPSAGTATASRHGVSSTWLITIEGEHDIATRSLLEQTMTGVGPACRVVVVDLSAASFVDASVVNWLAQLQGSVPNVDGRALRVVVGAAPGAAGRLFGLLRLGEMFACFPSAAAATY
jgi:anti-anti-sigma regulatory factor